MAVNIHSSSYKPMTTYDNLDAAPVERQKTAMDRARESWHSDACPVPGCHDLKRRAKDWFCLTHYRRLPADVVRGLGRRYLIVAWLQALAILKDKD